MRAESGYKITRAQCRGVDLDKWYIRPNAVYMSCSDKDVIQYFKCCFDEFYKVLVELGGTRENYRSGFPTREAAEAGAEKLESLLLLRTMIA